MPDIARHLLIRGRVQGVGFRWSTVQAAQQRGVGGWVRNLRDGSVEVLACGEESAVLDLILWARGGPPGARVDELVVEAPRLDAPFATSFQQLPTK